MSQSKFVLWEWIERNKEWIFSGIGVAIMTGTVTIAPRLLRRIKAKQRNTASYLIGRWNCTWITNSPQNYVEPLIDVVHITKAKGNQFEGYGDNPDIGRYLITGENHSYALTLNYVGVGEKKDLVGVILLKKEPLRSQLSGTWIQLIQTEQLARGKTRWNKISS